MTAQDVLAFCHLTPRGEEVLHTTMRRPHLSVRAYHRVLKEGRTIADLDSADLTNTPHFGDALEYRKREGDWIAGPASGKQLLSITQLDIPGLLLRIRNEHGSYMVIGSREDRCPAGMTHHIRGRPNHLAAVDSSSSPTVRRSSDPGDSSAWNGELRRSTQWRPPGGGPGPHHCTQGISRSATSILSVLAPLSYCTSCTSQPPMTRQWRQQQSSSSPWHNLR
jgi:hypothetical protein